MMEKEENKRFYRRWWFWGGAALVLVVAAAAVVLAGSKPAESMEAEMAQMTAFATNAPDELMTSTITEAPQPAASAIILTNPDRSDAEISALPVFEFGIEEWVDTMSGLTTSVGLPALESQYLALQETQFTINQSDYVFYMGRLNQSGQTYTLMMGGYGDGSNESSSEIILSMTLLVASLHPEYAPTESGAVIKELGILSGTLPETAQLTKDGTAYEFVNDPEFGILFFASPQTPN